MCMRALSHTHLPYSCCHKNLFSSLFLHKLGLLAVALQYLRHQMNRSQITFYLQLLLPPQTCILKLGLTWTQLRTSFKCLFQKRTKASEPFIISFIRLCQKQNTEFWKSFEFKTSFCGRNTRGEPRLRISFLLLDIPSFWWGKVVGEQAV